SSTTPGRSDLAMVRPKRVAFRARNSVGARGLAFAAQWLAYALPYRRFVGVLTDANARLGADVDRYSFIVVDLHHLILAGLPAHFESYMPSHAVRSLWLIYGTSKNSRRSTRLARLKRARPRAGVALARTISSVPRLALRQKAVRRSHRLRHDNWVIGSRCGRNSFSSGTTSVLRAVFASRDEPVASAPALFARSNRFRTVRADLRSKGESARRRRSRQGAPTMMSREGEQ